MPNQSNMSTIMFSDIAGSTQLYEKLGDEAAQQIIAMCLEKFIFVVRSHRGEIVKTIGDELMCTFPAPDKAAAAAKDQQELTISDTFLLSQQIKVRIGFHHGGIVHDGQDVFGDAVNVAARVVSLSKANQILTTGATLNLLSGDQMATARLVDQTRVKGKRDIIELFELSWGRPEEMTIIGTIHKTIQEKHRRDHPRLHVTFARSDFVVDLNSPLLSMGRDGINTITVGDPKVSRLHAHIELRKDKFIIADKSTNGTYIYTEDGSKLILRRDEMRLPEKGRISLGQELAKESPFTIFFTCLPFPDATR